MKMIMKPTYLNSKVESLESTLDKMQEQIANQHTKIETLEKKIKEMEDSVKIANSKAMGTENIIDEWFNGGGDERR